MGWNSCSKCHPISVILKRSMRGICIQVWTREKEKSFSTGMEMDKRENSRGEIQMHDVGRKQSNTEYCQWVQNIIHSKIQIPLKDNSPVDKEQENWPCFDCTTSVKPTSESVGSTGPRDMLLAWTILVGDFCWPSASSSKVILAFQNFKILFSPSIHPASSILAASLLTV